MTLRVPLFCAALLGLAIPLSGAPQKDKDKELTGRDLLAEYERLAPINKALKDGHWVIAKDDYPKTLGIFNSREVREVYSCGGDLCPQNSAVDIVYSGVTEEDCASLGEALHFYGWGKHYRGCSPLVHRKGNLVDNKLSSWSIAYAAGSDRKEPRVQERLLFDDSSQCDRRGEKISCGDFSDGEQSSVVGTKSRDSLSVVQIDLW
jgi:hypothetical protein